MLISRDTSKMMDPSINFNSYTTNTVVESPWWPDADYSGKIIYLYTFLHIIILY